jgi:EmrB/QacA subfamily drug resistance transporter
MTSTTATQIPAPARTSNRWLILVVVALAQLMVVLDSTVVNIALPKAQVALHISDAERQWVVTAYALTFGGLLLLGGRIADYWGRKRSFIVGMIGFALASALGGLAQSSGELFAARAIQGVFGALLAPAALSILQVTFTESSERAKAFAVYGLIAGGGSGVGLVVGGLLTEYASWRWCLLVNIPVAIIGVFAALPLLTESKAEGQGKYDIPGAVAVTAGIASLVFGFTEAAQAGKGWSSPLTIGFLVAAVVLLAAFVIVELRSDHPLLPLRIVLHPSRGGAYLTSLLAGAALLGGLLFLTYYYQGTLGYSALKSGLASLPLVGTLLISAPLVTVLVVKVGPRPLMTGGGIIAAVAMFLLTRIGVHTAYVTHVLPGLIILGLGLACLFIPLSNVALVGVPADDAGAASALVNATQQVGGAVGTALFNTIFTGAVTGYVASHTRSASTQAHSLVHGYTTSFTWAAVALLLAAVVAATLIRTKRNELPDEVLPVG